MESLANQQQHEDTKLFRSKLADIHIPNHLPLHTYCFENISRFQTRPCLIDSSTNEVYTYEQVQRTSRKVGLGFIRQIGIHQGETIMLLLPNCPQYVFAFLGASYIGASSTMANPHFTPGEIIKQATSSCAKLIISQSRHLEKIRSYAVESGTKLMSIDEPPQGDSYCTQFLDLMTPDDDEGDMTTTVDVEINPDDVVALPYSSGTTGLPKGVMVSHKTLVTNVAQQVDGEIPHLDFHSEDVMMCVLPLFHSYALNCTLLCGLRVGAAILLVERFELSSFLENIERHKVTILQLVPPIVLAMTKMMPQGNEAMRGEFDLSSVRIVMSAAAPLAREVQDAFRLIIPHAIVGQGYGMTEASGLISSMCLAFAKDAEFRFKSGSCGILLRNVSVKITDRDSGASLGYNKRGEILVRGDQVVKGYLNDPKSTKRTIDKQGWLHTGDIGFIDSDDELFIVERAKEIIKCKGFQVAPAELEGILLSNPHISDAAVVSMEDDQAGEVPVAFVVRKIGSSITEDEIKLFVSMQVIYYKRIHRVLFIDEIPKSPYGKILKKDLQST